MIFRNNDNVKIKTGLEVLAAKLRLLNFRKFTAKKLSLEVWKLKVGGALIFPTVQDERDITWAGAFYLDWTRWRRNLIN